MDSILRDLNKAILSEELKRAELNPLSIGKFSLSEELSGDLKFKSIFSTLYKMTNYSPILQDEEREFIFVIRDRRLHSAMGVVQRFKKEIESNLKVNLEAIALTEFDNESDDLLTLLKRLNRYFIKSMTSNGAKIFYGSRDLDLFISSSDSKETLFELLGKISKKEPKFRAYNFYRGVPISEDLTAKEFKNGKLVAKVDRNRAVFLSEESFTFLEHPLLFNIIKTDIESVDIKSLTITLENFTILDNSPVDREHVRVSPSHKSIISIESKELKEIRAELLSISITNVEALLLKSQDIENLEPLKDREIELKFTLVDSFSNSAIVLSKGRIFSIFKDERKVIFKLSLNRVSEDKILSFIKSRQRELISDLKRELMLKYSKSKH